MRTILDPILDDMEGRRLFARDASHQLADVALPLLEDGEIEPLLGLTSTECNALCAALGNATSQHGCKATAFRWQSPEDPASLEVAGCWLLKNLGTCSTLDFAAQLYDRRNTDPCSSPTVDNNPLCLRLQPDIGHLRTLDFGMTTTACAKGRGSPKMPDPKSSLEAMSMIAEAASRGITAFYAYSPLGREESVVTHWVDAQGSRLVVPAFNRQCILVHMASEVSNVMVAELVSCRRVVDGTYGRRLPVRHPHQAWPSRSRRRRPRRHGF